MADKLELMTVPCRHEVPDNSGRRYTICKKSWYFLADVLITNLLRTFRKSPELGSMAIIHDADY